MILYLLEIFSLIIFWRFADFSRFSEFLPLMLTGAFLRFLDHYLLIDWLKLWDIDGNQIWIPLSANLSIWIAAVYLYIQWFPKTYRFLYTLGWTVLMTFYLSILKWQHIFTTNQKWSMLYSFFIIWFYFGLIYILWKWLYPQKKATQKV